jgi:hypothetical protein
MNHETRMLKNLWQNKQTKMAKRKKKSLLEFVTQRSGFGYTPWPAAILIHSFGIASIVMAFTDSPWALLGLMAPVTLWYGTYMNYIGKWK